MKSSAFLGLFVIFICSTAEGQLVSLTNCRVLDVESGELLSGSYSITIVGNRINNMGQTRVSTPDADQIDLNGMVVIPGLIDLHSHLLLHPYDEASWNEQVLNESLELRTIRGVVAAKTTVESGFTTIRDLGTEGAAFADVGLRDAINQGMIPGPRIYAATRALVTTGGYGPMGFDPRWKMPVGAQPADGVDGVRRATRQQIAAGADWIKIYVDYRRKPGDPSTPTFSQEELDAIVDEANTAGLPVSAHATTDEGMRRAIQAGVNTIEHGYDASPETLRLMKENDVVLCPTLMASYAMATYSGWDPKSATDHPRIVKAKTLIRNAIEADVKIACGSDVGVFPHGESAKELELMFAYGMPAEDVIRSATSLAAQVLGHDELGQVKKDFVADLVIVSGNPVEDISRLRNPLVVIKDGIIVHNIMP